MTDTVQRGPAVPPSMSDDAVAGAARFLLEARHSGVRSPALPADIRPATLEDGYRVQDHLVRAAGRPTAGWKVAATNHAGQIHLGIDHPLAGRLFADAVFEDGARVPFADNRMALVEGEFAFVFDSDLDAGASGAGEIAAAVGSLHAALEIPDTRFENEKVVGAPMLVADNACGRDFVLGPPIDCNPIPVDLADMNVRLVRNDEPAGAGSGRDVLGNPFTVLGWLAAFLHRRGRTIRAGEIVTTGLVGKPVFAFPGDTVRAEFAGGAVISVTLT